ncbi:hypothetical protein SAY87_022945 [Trapa incisa]|uniref:Uncharacterized protein n=1 Tax=Trapa incisa TaxID=236973 RepID=A0AAN7Q694_9MYRT|nr:hypothetical protein SAY87_022945 [Trapa incisa]
MAASSGRSALMAGSRSLATKSKILVQGVPTSRQLSSTVRPFFSASRYTTISVLLLFIIAGFVMATHSFGCLFMELSILGGPESPMPLHSAVASARLKSNIAIDSSFWSWLSRGRILSPSWSASGGLLSAMLVRVGQSVNPTLGKERLENICGGQAILSLLPWELEEGAHDLHNKRALEITETLHSFWWEASPSCM